MCSVLLPPSRQWESLRKDILLPLYSLILSRVSTRTQYNFPYSSLSPYVNPHPYHSLISVFAQEGRKSAYPHSVCASFTWSSTARESTALPVPSNANLCVHMYSKLQFCVCVCVHAVNITFTWLCLASTRGGFVMPQGQRTFK